jgi:hypothetical protein
VAPLIRSCTSVATFEPQHAVIFAVNLGGVRTLLESWHRVALAGGIKPERACCAPKRSCSSVRRRRTSPSVPIVPLHLMAIAGGSLESASVHIERVLRAGGETRKVQALSERRCELEISASPESLSTVPGPLFHLRPSPGAYRWSRGSKHKQRRL